MDNLYRSPKAELISSERPKGSAVKAVAVGLLVDVGGSLIVAVVGSVAYGIWLAASGMSKEDAAAALTSISITSPYGLVTTFIGLLFTVLAGYICSTIVREKDVMWSAVMGLLSGLIGVIFLGESFGLGEWIVLSTLTLIAAMLGGYVGFRKRT